MRMEYLTERRKAKREQKKEKTQFASKWKDMKDTADSEPQKQRGESQRESV